MTVRAVRSSKRWVAVATAVAVGVGGAAFTNTAGADDLSLIAGTGSLRLAGADRYETSARIAETLAGVYCVIDPNRNPLGAAGAALASGLAMDGLDRIDVILASGENFPDGLAASALAADRVAPAVPGPVLLTRRAGLSPFTVEALDTINTLCNGDDDGVAGVTIVGGPAAVSNTVVEQLEDWGADVARIAGADRYATALAIADAVGPVLGPDRLPAPEQQIILATGTNFPDALSAGSVAAASGIPIILNRGTSLLPAVAEWIDGALQPGDLVWVMGGDAAIPASVEDELVDAGYVVQRVAGADRYATSGLFAGMLFTPPADGNVMLVSGENFADALSAGPLAGFANAPLLLTRRASLPSPISDYLADNVGSISTVWAAGGTAAISEAVLVDALRTAAGDEPAVAAATWDVEHAATPAQAVLTVGGGAELIITVLPEVIPGAFGNDLRVSLEVRDPADKVGTVVAPDVTFMETDSGVLVITADHDATLGDVVDRWNSADVGAASVATAVDLLANVTNVAPVLTSGASTDVIVVVTFTRDVVIDDLAGLLGATRIRTPIDPVTVGAPTSAVAGAGGTTDAQITFTWQGVTDPLALRSTIPAFSFFSIAAPAGAPFIVNADVPLAGVGQVARLLELAS